MCGIVGVVAERNAVPILMEGLRRLEYRGYDSAGIAVIGADRKLERLRTVGKVKVLEEALEAAPIRGTRRHRAHPLGDPRRAERAQRSPARLARRPRRSCTTASSKTTRRCARACCDAGYQFDSETDTEVIAHRIHHHLARRGDLFKAVRATVAELEGAYALAVVSESDPDAIDARARGLPGGRRTRRRREFRRLRRRGAAAGDATLHVSRGGGRRRDPPQLRARRRSRGQTAPTRAVRESELSADAAENGPYRHFMLKEIHEQPRAVAQTLAGAGRRAASFWMRPSVPPLASRSARGESRAHRQRAARAITPVLVARLLHRADLPDTLRGGDRERVPLSQAGRHRRIRCSLRISQSGETADTLAALRNRKTGRLSLHAVDLQRRRKARWCASRSSSC